LVITHFRQPYALPLNFHLTKNLVRPPVACTP
jgi:hypothetical protein